MNNWTFSKAHNDYSPFVKKKAVLQKLQTWKEIKKDILSEVEQTERIKVTLTYQG